MAFLCCSANNPQTSHAAGLCRLGNPGYFARREINCLPKFYRQKFDDKTVLYSQFSSSISHYPPTEYDGTNGGVFGLDFSSDGTVLGAAMEKRSLLFFDPLSRKVIHNVQNAHTDCANSIRFLDCRLFVSCSDDHLVKLWDLRYLKQCVRTFRGHSSWVKNMEYDANNGILLTSGFDGFVYSWDINNFRENNETEYGRVFYTPGLMRMKLTPDFSKLVISTHWGYLLVFHNFDVHTCGQDLKDFKPNMFWIMLKTGAKFADCERRASYFTSSRNRVELIVDFPAQNDPDNITSITPHPHGWCILSRNTNHDDNSEYTCIHDIQLPPVDVPNDDSVPNRLAVPVQAVCLTGNGERLVAEPRVLRTTTESGRTIIAIDMLNRSNVAGAAADTISVDQSESESTNENSRNRNPIGSMSPNNEVSYGLVLPRDITDANNAANNGEETRAIILPRYVTDTQRQQRMVLILSNNGFGYPVVGPSSPSDTIHMPKTYKRLIYYAEEPNVGRGFIKEQAFSPDGRLIASPFGYGVRFLAFNDDFQELCDCVTPDAYRNPSKLVEAGVNVSHRDNVLCTRFSPVHMLLATGCLGGKVVFHQPLL